MNTESTTTLEPVDQHHDVAEVAKYEVMAPPASVTHAATITRIDMSPRQPGAPLPTANGVPAAPYQYLTEEEMKHAHVPSSVWVPEADEAPLTASVPVMVVMADGRVLTVEEADAEDDARVMAAVQAQMQEEPGAPLVVTLPPNAPVLAPDVTAPATPAVSDAWFSDEDNSTVGSVRFERPGSAPQTVWFGALPDALVDEILDMPLKFAHDCDCTVKQAVDMAWLQENRDYEKVWPVIKYLRDLFARVRAASVKRWTFPREVTVDNIEKLPDAVRLALAERVMEYVRTGEAESVFTLPSSLPS